MPDPGWDRVERASLAHRHAVNKFSSGNTTVDEWLHRNGIVETESRRTNTFLCLFEKSVVGFFTLKMSTVNTAELSRSMARGESSVASPAALICWLAIDTRYQGRGLLKPLLTEALSRCAASDALVPYRFLIIDAIDETLVTVYERAGFTRVGQTTRLVMKMSAVARIVEHCLP
jgi:ribosomal protein S18 acetylase RimI-like enzyme